MCSVNVYETTTNKSFIDKCSVNLYETPIDEGFISKCLVKLNKKTIKMYYRWLFSETV